MPRAMRQMRTLRPTATSIKQICPYPLQTKRPPRVRRRPRCCAAMRRSSERIERLEDFLQGFNVTSQNDLQWQHCQHSDAARRTLAGHRQGVRQVRSELLAGTTYLDFVADRVEQLPD